MNRTDMSNFMKTISYAFIFCFSSFVQSAEQDAIDQLWGQNFKGWSGVYFDCMIDVDGPDLDDLCSILGTNFSYLASSLSIPNAVGTGKDSYTKATEAKRDNYLRMYVELNQGSSKTITAISGRSYFEIFMSNVKEQNHSNPRSGSLIFMNRPFLASSLGGDLNRPIAQALDKTIKDMLLAFKRNN